MAKYRLTGPDGASYEVTAPDNVGQDEVLRTFHANLGSQPAAPAAQQSPQQILEAAGLTPQQHRLGNANTIGGLVRGAGSIGATILYPIDKITDMVKGDREPGLSSLVTGQQPLSRNQERRRDMDAALGNLGADTNSLAYGGSKMAAEVAGTAGMGGLLGNVARALRASPAVVNALTSGGFRTGAAPANAFAGRAIDAATRATAGGAVGGATAGLVDPEAAGKGALVGAVLPGGVQAAEAAGGAARNALEGGARRLMQSAIKPTIAQLRSGDAGIAVDELLKRGISPNARGVDKLNALVDDLNSQISGQISASGATVPKANVLNALSDVRQKFGNQVSPTNDLAAIQRVGNDFMAHPNLPGNDIPVQQAQAMKQGTYQVLKGKYGEAGSAETEAQKALARGLKEEIAAKVPGVGALNAEESRLLTTLSVAERRALMEMNKNPLGLSTLAKNPAGWLAFMADKSAGFKALAARMLNASTPVAASAGQNLLGAAGNPLVRNAAVVGLGANP